MENVKNYRFKRFIKPQLRADGRFSVLFYARRAAVMSVVIPSMKRFHDNVSYLRVMKVAVKVAALRCELREAT